MYIDYKTLCVSNQFAFLFLTVKLIDASDVAVIIGGCDSATYLTCKQSSEVYSGQSTTPACKNGNIPTVPDFPGTISQHTSVYVPEHGIYVCGGRDIGNNLSTSCYVYNPRSTR